MHVICMYLFFSKLHIKDFVIDTCIHVYKLRIAAARSKEISARRKTSYDGKLYLFIHICERLKPTISWICTCFLLSVIQCERYC